MATPFCFLHLSGPTTDLVASVCQLNTRTSEPPDHPLPRHTVVLPSSSENIIVQLPIKEEMERFKQEMTLSPDEVKEVERNTQAQSDNPIWFEKRRKGGTELQHQSVGKCYKGPQEQQHMQ